MKRFLLPALLILSSHARGQKTDVDTLRSKCVPTAPSSTLQALIQVESGGDSNAMQVDFPKALLKHWRLPAGSVRLKRQPVNAQEASDWLAYFQSNEISVDVGLMQVSTAEARRRGILPESLLEPCTNLRVGWQILEDDYLVEMRIRGPGQDALRHAISRYNTGDSQQGFANGYVGRVLTAIRRLPPEEQDDIPSKYARSQP